MQKLLTYFFVAVTGTLSTAFNSDIGPEEQITALHSELVALMADSTMSEDDKALKVESLTGNLFSFEAIARESLDPYWESFSELWKTRFLSGFRERLANEMFVLLLGLVEENGEVPALTFESSSISDQSAKLVITFNNGGREMQVEGRFGKQPGGWKLVNLTSGTYNMIRYFRNKVRGKIEAGLSYNVALSKLRALPYILVEDFSGPTQGELPEGWGWREKDNDKMKVNSPYSVKEENGNRYLSAVDKGQSVILIREFKWNIKKYPCLSWRWRVHALPSGGDERYDETNDSAAGVYVIFYQNFLGMPKVVKYAWSSSLEKCETTQRRKFITRPYVVVARSGTKDTGQWITEEFNAYDDFVEAFGEDPPEITVAICILSDANKTRSVAAADYDDIIVKKKCKDPCE